MNKSLVIDIIESSFKTIYPDKDFDIEKENRWLRNKETLAHFHVLGSGEIFKELVLIIFYAGIKASTVTSRKDVILNLLDDYRKVATFNEDDIARLLAAKDMIHHNKKIRACIYNANAFMEIDKNYGSFKKYILSFNEKFPDDNQKISNLLGDIQRRLKYMGARTSRHFLMVLGFPLVKPDVMVMRVLFRLGLVSGETDEYIEEAEKICLEISKKAKVPANFVDELLVKIGQSEGVELCKKKNPKCEKCGLSHLCRYDNM